MREMKDSGIEWIGEISGTYIYSSIYKSVEYDFDTNSFQNITRKKV